MTGIGLLGCGAMGREIASSLLSGKAGDGTLVAYFDEDPQMTRTFEAEVAASLTAKRTFESFLATPRLELVVECASPDAVRAYAEAILSEGKDLMMMSSGALTDSALFQRLTTLAEQRASRFLIPSGALGGIDAVRAVRGRLKQVTLTTTKPPRALRGAPGFKEWESQEITRPQVVFEGPAAEAVRLFPANVNVSATLSLAGLGPQKTRVKVVADPQSMVNTHEVVARGDFGVLRFRMELLPHRRNPRTSALAVVSAIETLRSACSSGPRIGT